MISLSTRGDLPLVFTGCSLLAQKVRFDFGQPRPILTKTPTLE